MEIDKLGERGIFPGSLVFSCRRWSDAGFVQGGFSSIGGDVKKRLKKKLIAKRLARLSLMPVPVDDMRIINSFFRRFIRNVTTLPPEIFEEISERPWDFV